MPPSVTQPGKYRPPSVARTITVWLAGLVAAVTLYAIFFGGSDSPDRPEPSKPLAQEDRGDAVESEESVEGESTAEGDIQESPYLEILASKEGRPADRSPAESSRTSPSSAPSEQTPPAAVPFVPVDDRHASVAKLPIGGKIVQLTKDGRPVKHPLGDMDLSQTISIPDENAPLKLLIRSADGEEKWHTITPKSETENSEVATSVESKEEIAAALEEFDDQLNTGPAKPEHVSVSLRGRVVWLNEALGRRYSIRTAEDAAEQMLILEADDGTIHPIVEDTRGRGFRLDDRLRDRPVEVLARQYVGSPMIQVIRLYLVREDGRYELDYWCDICAIQMFQHGVCDCCQGDNRLRERKDEGE